MTSTDGLVWEKSINPICSTFVGSGSAYSPAGDTKYAPQLFSIDTRLFVRPNSRTVQGDSIFYSENLTHWNYAELSYSLNIADCVYSNNMTVFLGYSWDAIEWRLGILTGNNIENLSEPYRTTGDSYPYSHSFSEYHCFIRGDYILVFINSHPLYIWDTKLNKWEIIPLPEEISGYHSYVFTSFKNNYYKVGTDGTFRMNID